MDDLERELKVSFLDEATQHLDDCEKCFLDLENNKNNDSYIEKIFRLAHNLKGTSRAVGFDHFAVFTHELESLLLKIKHKELPVTDETVTLLLECNDHMRLMVGLLRKNLDAKIDHGEVLEKIKAHAHKQPSVTTAKPTAAPAATPAIASVSPRPQKKSETKKAGYGTHTDESLRVPVNRIDQLNNFVGELIILQAVLQQHSYRVHHPIVLKTITQLGKISKEIQQISMSCRMVPIRQTFQKLQRVARDTSVTLNKLVDLDITGEETEVDKTVVEHLSDPLVHIIRNAVDHGLESPAERLKLGKPERGTLQLRAFQKGSYLVVEIQDDGRGLDEEVIKARAIAKGFVAPDSNLSQEDTRMLIFKPGFSTKEAITEISGRGVGLDVVKTNIERLAGDIQIESEKGKGTLFRIFFPLTLAMTDGLVILAGREKFVVPLAQIQETVVPTKDQIQTVNNSEVLNLRGETLPVFSLKHLLGWDETTEKTEPVFNKESLALVIKGQRNSCAILIDEILRQQQIVMKQMGPEIRNRQGLLGSTILGDGRPTMVLDLHDLVKKRAVYTEAA